LFEFCRVVEVWEGLWEPRQAQIEGSCVRDWQDSTAQG
jgi:hypothetical protein